MCTCGPEPETTLHCLLRYNFYSDLRTETLNAICALNPGMRVKDFDFPRRIYGKC